MVAGQLSTWTLIVIGALALVGVFFALGYGLIALSFLIVFGGMVGGALLYWADGE